MTNIWIGMFIGLVIGTIVLYLYTKLPETDCKIFKDTSTWLMACLERLIFISSVLLQLTEEAEEHWKAEVVIKYGDIEKSPRVEAIKTIKWAKETYDLLKPMLEKYFELSGDKAEFPELSQHLQNYIKEVLENE